MINSRNNWAGALVLRLLGEIRIQEVMGSNPSTGDSMDIFHICCKIVLFV